MKVRTTFKVKVGESEKEIGFRNPNQEELLALDLEYRKVFSQCLREGIMSEAEARKIAEKNAVWTKEDDKRISQLAFQIGIFEAVVNDTTEKVTPEQKEESVTKLSDIRSEMIGLINQKVDIVSKSAEGLANQQRMHKFVQFCCVNLDGSRFFENMDSYEMFIQEYPDVLSEIYKQAYFYEYGDPEKLTEEWAEIKYVRNKVKEAEKEVKEEKKTKKKKELAQKE